MALGFVIKGECASDDNGRSVSSAGDVNGDGLTDLIIGAPFADPPNNREDAGRVYVVFGKASNTPIELSSLLPANNTLGFVINGKGLSENSGFDVSGAGDINGDGWDDLIVSTYVKNTSTGEDVGRVNIVFGKPDGSPVELSAVVNGVGGFLIGSGGTENIGSSVSMAGDVNGDGLADMIIGAMLADPSAGTDAGQSYVVFGKTSPTQVVLSSIVNGVGGFVINGASAGDTSGNVVSSAGDVNGDGLADLIIGAVRASSRAGRAFVVFGKTDGNSVNLATVSSGTGGFAINGEGTGDNAGIYVSGAGDVDGDGMSDLIVGANSSSAAGANAGRSYVVFGKTSTSTISLANIANGTGGFVLNGQGLSDFNGISVSDAGDVNGDGFADVIVSSPFSDPSAGSDAGRSYIVFGKTTGDAFNLSTIAAGTGGFVINGQGLSDISGISVSAAGDVNGDGLADVIVGAPKVDANGSDSGASYVVFGKTDTSPVNLSAMTADARSIVVYANVPTSLADSFSGTSASEVILGAAGNDSLSGGGGTDVLLGGAGNDVLTINADNISRLQAGALVTADPAGFNRYQLARVDGGAGIDTLAVTGGANLNLTLIKQIALGNPQIGSRISSIERIDLATDTAANMLTLSLRDVMDMSEMNVFKTGTGWTSSALGTLVDKHQVVINRGANDIVDLSDGSGTAGWTSVGTVLNGTITYDIWNSTTGNAQLIIQQGSTVI